MKGYRIQIIRHGQTEANEKGIYIGKTDYPLSEKGKKELVDKLDEFDYSGVERVYSSPLKRCLETAAKLTENFSEISPADIDLFFKRLRISRLVGSARALSVFCIPI